MEWNIEYQPFVLSLGWFVMGVLPNAPDGMKKVARKLNRASLEYYGWNEYVGMDPKKQGMQQLKKSLPIIAESEHTVTVELPGKSSMIQREFPKYGIECKNNEMVAITESTREDFLNCNTYCKFKQLFFDPSALDVSGPY